MSFHPEMGLVPCANGGSCLQAKEEGQSINHSSTSLSSQPSLPTVPSLTIPHTHLPPTHHHCISTLKAHSSAVFSLALSSKSHYSGASNGEIRLWPTHPPYPSTPTPNNVVAVAKTAVKSIAVHHNMLITAHQDHKIRVWDIHRGYKLSATLPTLKDRLLRFLPPKNHVQVRRHKKCTWVHHVDAVSALAVSADGATLFSVSWDRTLKIWRTSDFTCLESVANAHDDAINALAVSPGRLYTGSADTKIKVWHRPPGHRTHSLLATLEKHRSAVNALALSPDGSVLYSGACDRSVVVWDTADDGPGMEAVGALRGHAKAILCLGAVENVVCSGSADRTVRVWRRGSDRFYFCLAVLEGHAGPVKSLAVALDRFSTASGSALSVYSGGLDCEIKVWEVEILDLDGINGLQI